MVSSDRRSSSGRVAALSQRSRNKCPLPGGGSDRQGFCGGALRGRTRGVPVSRRPVSAIGTDRDYLHKRPKKRPRPTAQDKATVASRYERESMMLQKFGFRLRRRLNAHRDLDVRVRALEEATHRPIASASDSCARFTFSVGGVPYSVAVDASGKFLIVSPVRRGCFDRIGDHPSLIPDITTRNLYPA